jgi:hypothetical protein
MRTLAEGSIDRARAKRTQRGQGLRPPAVTRRAANETKWDRRPIPLSPWERGMLSPWEWECTFLECQIDLVQREGGERTECDWAVPSLSLLERGRLNCERVKDLAKWNELVVQSLSLLERAINALVLRKNELSKPLKKRQNTHKLVIFVTFMVEKWIFVIKMYSFLKNMLYLFTWTYQRGALICLRYSKRPS